MAYMPAASGASLEVPGFPDQVMRLGTQPTLMEGSGVVLLPDVAARRIRIIAGTTDPALSLSHFHPGTLPAVDTLVRQWRNNRLTGTAVGSVLEVWCGTPPADVAAGNYGIRFSGTAGGSTDLQLNVDGQKHYTLDLQAPSAIYQVGQDSWALNTFGRGYRGSLTQMRASTDVEIWGMSFRAEWNFGEDLPLGLRRFGITDELGSWLVYKDERATYTRGGQYFVRFPYPLAIKAGQAFGVGALGMEPGVQMYSSRASYQPKPGFSNSNLGWIPGNIYSNNVEILGDADPNITFADVVGTQRVDPDFWWMANSPTGYSLTQGHHNAFSLLGRTNGVAFSGDLRATVISTGAPSVVPGNVNIRMEIAPN